MLSCRSSFTWYSKKTNTTPIRWIGFHTFQRKQTKNRTVVSTSALLQVSDPLWVHIAVSKKAHTRAPTHIPFRPIQSNKTKSYKQKKVYVCSFVIPEKIHISVQQFQDPIESNRVSSTQNKRILLTVGTYLFYTRRHRETPRRNHFFPSSSLSPLHLLEFFHFPILPLRNYR